MATKSHPFTLTTKMTQERYSLRGVDTISSTIREKESSFCRIRIYCSRSHMWDGEYIPCIALPARRCQSADIRRPFWNQVARSPSTAHSYGSILSLSNRSSHARTLPWRTCNRVDNKRMVGSPAGPDMEIRSGATLSS